MHLHVMAEVFCSKQHVMQPLVGTLCIMHSCSGPGHPNRADDAAMQRSREEHVYVGGGVRGRPWNNFEGSLTW